MADNETKEKEKLQDAVNKLAKVLKPKPAEPAGS